ncbi:hypothetical protein GLOTRDRAFT_82569 [Gloeophyllum trabeum ATCC 11539]|uniref:DUF6532 domain-containing protein n=1 Tax=Gloeophyllum trabeum (strain ATCC 11539 / FP-39264 / Madison 617) TaxID=670483 RepID=S7RCK7_GLOTA|nr:uncharacterized protein GLOTRDRAFT_82569 [Gloeophyllum trabeum ATCC 11539]EPQ50129.1 hypothetical protein GLOTRDRAFT_82569 [Gloeophyllum trabeum ATCC 11539]
MEYADDIAQRHVEVPHRLDAQQLGIPRAAQIAYAPVQLDEEDLEYLSESGDERSAAVEVPGFAPRGPLTAANNLRRPRPAPSGPTMETTRFTKKPKVEAVGGSGTRGRVLDSDFPREKRGAVKGSQHHFRCLISSDAPFPNTDLATEFCREAWGKACKDQGIDMEFGPLVVSMLTDRAPQIRGEIKIKARTLVPSYYKLLDKNSKADAQTIRARVEMLKDNEAFVHENPEERTGRYKHPIIQAVINETWYSSQRDEGVEYSEYFSEKVAFNVGGRRKSGFGIPLVTIALVLTAVQCALDEWATGQRSGVEFSEKTYGPVFEHHLSKLDTLKEKMADMEIVERIQSQLLDGARWVYINILS